MLTGDTVTDLKNIDARLAALEGSEEPELAPPPSGPSEEFLAWKARMEKDLEVALGRAKELEARLEELAIDFDVFKSKDRPEVT